MKLQVTESQLKLIEQQQLNELKWLGNIQSHIGRMDIPLTPSIINYIWGKQKVTTFHIGDVNGIDKIGEMIGTRKALSTFRFMEKEMIKDIRGIQTEGGIIYQIIGDLLFDAPSDIMSTPDESGRRWITLHVLPHNFIDKFDKEFLYYNKFNDVTEPKDLINYYRWVDGLIKEHAKEIREHFTDIKKNRGDRESMWNETVVNNIRVVDILWKESIIEFIEKWETKESSIIKVLEEVGSKLNSIANGSVYLADNNGAFGFRDIDPIKWVEQRGGLTEFKKYVNKFHKDKEPKTIEISEAQETKHFIDRLNNRVFVKNLDVVLLGKLEGGDYVDQVIGQLPVTTEVINEIKLKIETIQSLRFPKEQKIAVLLYDYHLRYTSKLKYIDKDTKMFTTKTLKNGNCDLFVLDPMVPHKKGRSQKNPKGQILLAFIHGGKLVSVYYATYNRLENKLYDYVAYDMDELKNISI